MKKRRLSDKQLYRAVGKRLAQFRRLAGLTQSELCSLSGGKLTRTSIANMEIGRQRVSLHHVYIFADVLKVWPSDLLPRAVVEEVR